MRKRVKWYVFITWPNSFYVQVLLRARRMSHNTEELNFHNRMFIFVDHQITNFVHYLIKRSHIQIIHIEALITQIQVIYACVFL